MTLSHRQGRTFAPTPELSSALSNPASAIEKFTAAEYKAVLDSEKWTRSDTELVVKLASACYPLPIDWSSISIRLPKFSKEECRERYEHACAAAMTSHSKISTEKEKSTQKKSTKRRSKAKISIWKPSDFPSWTESRQKAWMRLAIDPNAYYMEFAKPDVPLSDHDWSSEEISLFKALLIERPPEGQWGLFSMWFPNRTGRQCQLLFESFSSDDDEKPSWTRDVYLRYNKRRKRVHRFRNRSEPKTESVTSEFVMNDSDPASALTSGKAEPDRGSSTITDRDGTDDPVPLAECGIEDVPVSLQIQSRISCDQRGDDIASIHVSASLQAESVTDVISAATEDEVPWSGSDVCRNDTACDQPIPIASEQESAEALCDFDEDSSMLPILDSVVEAHEVAKPALPEDSPHQNGESSEDFRIIPMKDAIWDSSSNDGILECPLVEDTRNNMRDDKSVRDDTSAISASAANDCTKSHATLRIPDCSMSFQSEKSDSKLHRTIESIRKQFLTELHNMEIGFRNSSERLKIVFRDRIAQAKDPESHLSLLAQFADEAANLVTMMRIQSDCLANVHTCRARRYLELGLIEIPRAQVPDMQL